MPDSHARKKAAAAVPAPPVKRAPRAPRTPRADSVPTRQELINVLTSIQDVTGILTNLAASLDDAARKVDLDTQAREKKVQRLEEQALYLQDQSAALHDQTSALRRYAKLIFAGFAACVVALFLMAFLIFQFNSESAARSKVASDQRNQQQVLLVKLNQQTAEVARCAITAKGNLPVYDACVRQVGS